MARFLLLAALPSAAGWGYCNDRDESCANWAKAGLCNPPEAGILTRASTTKEAQAKADVVKKLCPHSCSLCQHTCRDIDPSCPQWADNGQCETNIDFMFGHCSASCGVCKTKCYDKSDACMDWARAGECSKNPSALLTLCPVACGVCTDMCLDKHNDCPNWAADGQCGSNEAFMLEACPNSCNVCEKSVESSDSKVCADKDRNQCLIWGEHSCGDNPGAVMRTCPAMCGLCTSACEDKHRDCPNWKEGKKKDGKGCEDDPVYMLSNCETPRAARPPATAQRPPLEPPGRCNPMRRAPL